LPNPRKTTGEEAVCLVDVVVDLSVAVAILTVVVMMPLAVGMMLSAVGVVASAADRETDTAVAIAVDEAATVAAIEAALVAAEEDMAAAIEGAVVGTIGAAAIMVQGEREDRGRRHKTMASECSDIIMLTFLDLVGIAMEFAYMQRLAVHCAAA